MFVGWTSLQQAVFRRIVMGFSIAALLSSIGSATPLLVGLAVLLGPSAGDGPAGAIQVIAGLGLAATWLYLQPRPYLGTGAAIVGVGTLCAIAVWKVGALWPVSTVAVPPLKAVLQPLGSVAILVYVAITLLSLARRPGEPTVALQMPLRNVQWYVVHGGMSALTNHHRSVMAQRHANDIVVLGPDGRRAKQQRPRALDDFYAFGVPVESPCTGHVLAACGDLPDQFIGQADRINLAGNFVAIACNGVTVLLAHLRSGSVTVKTGDLVETGQTIGQIGNSGNTSEPHLHVHAIRGESGDMPTLISSGEGIPILFDGRYLRRGAEPGPNVSRQ